MAPPPLDPLLPPLALAPPLVAPPVPGLESVEELQAVAKTKQDIMAGYAQSETSR
jgi:hypothetical protein